ncbi:MAG: hypothetical protein MUO72_04710 [Bacteroidales bacterium]|nr:hypothetical protein [Bacteroidales bacterium]
MIQPPHQQGLISKSAANSIGIRQFYQLVLSNGQFIDKLNNLMFGKKKAKMMKRIFFTLMLVSLACPGWTQETYRNQFSSAPDTARYEIIQSELGARITLKIDKYDGQVYLLVESGKKLSWQLMAVEKHTQNKATPGKVNYQIFTSGLGVRFTFLLNVNTGATWQLAEHPEYKELFWSALE